MLGGFLTKVFGKFQSKQEVKKYTLLGVTFGVLIATYWALRPLKDGIFQSVVGADYQPYAKMLSLVVVLGLIMVYGKLVDMFPRHKVFYILTGCYALGAFLFYFLLSNPSIGIPNTVESPARIIGWAWYIFVESAGTLLVPLFWAFSTDASTADSAKRGFPLIMLCAQIGNIIGPWLLRANRLGFSGPTGSAPVVAIIGFMFLAVGLLIWVFMRVTPKSEFHVSEESKEKKPGFFDGLKLLLTKGYLFGIFLFLLAFEAVATIIDFYFKVQVKNAFPTEAARSGYLAEFAVVTGIVSTLCLLFGINNIQRKLGMRASLIATPLLMVMGIVVWRVYPQMSIVFWVLVAFKAINYALNQPSIKQLYIPTSKDARYKAQAWIEVFGSRGSKALGSGINATKLPIMNAFGAVSGASIFMTIASVASFGLLGLWVLVAFYVSAKYNKAVKEDSVVC